MTGRQENPHFRLNTLSGNRPPRSIWPPLCRLLGIRHVQVIDPNDLAADPPGAGRGDGPSRTIGHHHQPAVLPDQGCGNASLQGRRWRSTRCSAPAAGPACAWAVRRSSGNRRPTGKKGKARIDPLLCIRLHSLSAAVQIRRDQYSEKAEGNRQDKSCGNHQEPRTPERQSL